MLKGRLLSGAAVGVALCAAQPATAQTSGTMEQLQQQMRTLQQQMQTLQGQMNDAQAQQQQQQQQLQQIQMGRQSPPQAGNTGVATMTPGNRPGVCTLDGENCIQLTGRVHFDVGDYLSVKPQIAAGPHNLTSGTNVRRARLGVLGKFASDWNYALVFDFGGSTDSGSAGINASGIENAFVSYQGLKPAAIEIGVMDLPWTLEEAQSSNDILFLERASVGIVAQNLAAGDFRTAGGVRANDDRYWVGAYLTGPNTGALHTGSNEQQLGGVIRGTYQVLQSNNYSLHLGVDAEHVFTPRANGGSNVSVADTLTFSDRPELRVDPTTFLTTGAVPAKNADVYGAEIAGGWESLFFQGEYYHFTLSQAGQSATAPKPGLDFDGAYLEAAWAITGERRPYIPSTGAYGGLRPTHPLSFSKGGTGAWEVAARWSYVDLNSNAIPGKAQTVTGGVFGGRQAVYTVGVNWYPVNNVRFMLDFIHADVNKLAGNGVTPAGVAINAVAMRTQVAF